MKLLTWTRQVDGTLRAELPYEIEGNRWIIIQEDYFGCFEAKLNHSGKTLGMTWQKEESKCKDDALVWLISKIAYDATWHNGAAGIWERIIALLVEDIKK